MVFDGTGPALLDILLETVDFCHSASSSSVQEMCNKTHNSLRVVIDYLWCIRHTTYVVCTIHTVHTVHTTHTVLIHTYTIEQNCILICLIVFAVYSLEAKCQQSIEETSLRCGAHVVRTMNCTMWNLATSTPYRRTYQLCSPNVIR